MVRRRRSTQDTVSLFPFLSILACVIGVLTLMITAMALGQMEESSPSEEEITRQSLLYEQLQQRITSHQKEFDRLKSQIIVATSVRKELDEVRGELTQLLETQNRAISNNKLGAELHAESNRLRDRLAVLEPNQIVLVERIKQVQEELIERKAPREEAQVTIRPTGSGVNLDPTFVECRAEGIVILEGSTPQPVRRADLGKNKAYLDLIKRVSQQDRGTIVFLVRSDAVATYNAARNVSRSRYCKNGKLPVSGMGEIDLSLFEQIAGEAK